MGEISEALRRARELKSSEPAPERAPARAPESELRHVGPLRPADLPARDRPPAAPARDVAPDRPLDSLHPEDPAIVFSEAGPAAEACRNVAVRVRAEIEPRDVRSLAVVSAVSGEGKTTVLCDLGLALASLSSGREVALVDLDLRKPSLARVLGLRPSVGMERVLAGDAPLEAARLCIDYPQLDVYAASERTRAPHTLLSRPDFARVIGELEQRYRLVLIDTPPMLMFPDAGLILRNAGACIAVARAGVTRTRAYRQFLGTLPKSQVLGTLLNHVATPRYAQYYGAYDHAGDAQAAGADAE